MYVICYKVHYLHMQKVLMQDLVPVGNDGHHWAFMYSLLRVKNEEVLCVSYINT